MNRQVSINEIVDWIIINRFGNCCKDFTKEMITKQVIQSCHNNAISCYIDEKGMIGGVAYGYTYDNIFYVQQGLIKHPNALKNIVEKLFSIYPDYIILARRKGGRLMQIKNSKRFLNKL